MSGPDRRRERPIATVPAGTVPTDPGRVGKVALQAMTGPGAAARKYDLLSVIGAAALAAEPGTQRRMLRLMVLVTARYDWRRDRLAVGQREIAALWSVDERTVKREMARLRDAGWLILRRQGARGRVSDYALGIEVILADTKPHWGAIGPDLVTRLTVPTGGESVPNTDPPQGHQKVLADNVTSETVPATSVTKAGQGVWSRVSARLASEKPDRYAAWIAPLSLVEAGPEQLLLRAPSRFHASYVEIHLANSIWQAALELMPTLRSLRVQGPSA